MTERRILGEIADDHGARVVVERDRDGRTRSARLDLTGLPRVDALLLGQSAAEVPAIVERLCGICPAAHHLAGIRALEAVAGSVPIPPSAEAIRRLLHHGSAISTHAGRFLATDAKAAVALHAYGRLAMAAAGSPRHFPATAVTGGVTGPVSARARDELADQLPTVIAAATRIAESSLRGGERGAAFVGADVALADSSGRPDLLGERLRAVSAAGKVLHAAAPAQSWAELIAEAEPGSAAPRPYLVALGPEHGGYRVGPVAQLRVGAIATTGAGALQQRWLDAEGSAAAARAIMLLHSVEAIGALLELPALVAGSITTSEVGVPEREGVGWVDGPRGLLVHRYLVAEDGTVLAATILTPTAQNEPWLADLLCAAADAAQGDDSYSTGMEHAIREVDPCLPFSRAPIGAMGLHVDADRLPIESGKERH
jgi:NAD-reducing hydrogenase large subunit